jgi:receptor protein-tyrosine kinase
MSLVEQAAKRLEQLRQAGAHPAGDVPFLRRDEAQSSSAAAESTVERATRKLEALEAREPAGKHAGEEVRRLAPVPRDAGSELDTVVGLEGLSRREPTLAEAPAPVEEEPPIRLPGALPPRTIELELPALAARGFLNPGDDDSSLANQLRLIKRPLINNCQGKGAAPVRNANRIMLTSALPGEGKSFLALNLAMSIAMERDSTVLLIDADTTRPSLSELLGTHAHEGLMDLLTDPARPVGRALLRTNLDKLAFLPAGKPRPGATELLASELMQQLVDQLASRYTDRILIFDTPPLLAAPEPPVLAGYMGQIVVVVEADRTTHRSARHALAAVASCPVVMSVLNKAGRHDALYPRVAAAT